jgi:hypothetical protein
MVSLLRISFTATSQPSESPEEPSAEVGVEVEVEVEVEALCTLVSSQRRTVEKTPLPTVPLIR